MTQREGLTLIELLIVITIISILAAIIFVALDPAKRFSQARNARRFAEVNAILSAILQFQVDNDGDFPAGVDSVTGTHQILGTAGAGCDTGCTGAGGGTVAACLNMSGDLVDTYLSAIPLDPKDGTAAKTLYAINKSASGRINVIACVPELGETISIQR